jgi:hypothetical protein
LAAKAPSGSAGTTFPTGRKRTSPLSRTRIDTTRPGASPAAASIETGIRRPVELPQRFKRTDDMEAFLCIFIGYSEIGMRLHIVAMVKSWFRQFIREWSMSLSDPEPKIQTLHQTSAVQRLQVLASGSFLDVEFQRLTCPSAVVRELNQSQFNPALTLSR